MHLLFAGNRARPALPEGGRAQQEEGRRVPSGIFEFSRNLYVRE